MKENKYDDEEFLKNIVRCIVLKKVWMAQENGWNYKRFFLDFHQKKVLDLGCGYGWHCQYAAKQGASDILGVDISLKMLEVAKQKNNHPTIQYQCVAIEDLTLAKESFDIVLSSLALHYIKDFESLVKNISMWLTKEGEFVFSVEHPVFTSYGTQDWYYDENGNILHFPVDNYYYEGKREAMFLGEKVIVSSNINNIS